MEMNTFRLNFVLSVLAAIALLVFHSCAAGDYETYSDFGAPGPNAVVTVKTSASGATYFQLDEETTLEPVEWRSPYKSETRALLNYSELTSESADFTKQVKVNWIDSVLTKNAVAMSVSELSSEEGNDPVEVVDDWLTVCEDGYMTIHFVSKRGEDRITHKVSLGVNPDNPYVFYLRYDKNGDLGTYWKEEFAAFRIGDFVPASDQPVKITLHWRSYSGQGTLGMKCIVRDSMK